MTLARTDVGTETVTDLSGVINFDSSAFTTEDDSIVTVSVGVVNGEGGGDVRTGMVLSGGGLTWTKRAGPNGGSLGSPDYKSAHEIWTAPVTTGASMTLNYAHAGNVGSDRALCIFQITSHTSDSGSLGVGAIASGAHDQGDGAVSITLSAAPASSSEVVASRWYSMDSAAATLATPATGWTEIYDVVDNNYGALQSQIRGGSTSTSVDWDDVATVPATSFNSSAMAIEIIEVTASTFQPVWVRPTTLIGGM